jgi:RNA polymerase primary sigma factor
LLLTEPVVADEEAAEEAAAALATVDAEFGRTTDPVRMYMREMGTVELLTREGEIRIAKRIEEGLDAVRTGAVDVSADLRFMLDQYEQVKAGQGRLVDIIVGFIDPNAPDEIAAPVNPKLAAARRARGEEEEDDEGEGSGRRGSAGDRPRSGGGGAPLRFHREALPAGAQVAGRKGRSRIPRRRSCARRSRRVHGAEARAEDVRR